MSDIQVLKQFFGTAPGQSAVEFLKEIKTLDPADRTALAQEAATILGVALK